MHLPLQPMNLPTASAASAGPDEAVAPRRLALFDLDYTLLPIDSDYEWARFLIRLGVVDGAEYEQRNDAFFQAYKAGTLDIEAFLEFQLAPLGAHPPDVLERWHAQFMDEVIRPQIRPRALALVRAHLDRGDLCAIVTATNEFVTGPIARAFGIDHLIATLVERVDGRYTGRATGTPSYREGKILRTTEWLAGFGRGFEHVAQCGDEGVDAAAQVLQVDQQHVEAVHHGVGGASHLAVQAEYRDAQLRVGEVGRLDHVVLLVAAQTMLGAEGGAQAHVGQRRQRVQRVREVARDRGRMGQQGDAAAG